MSRLGRYWLFFVIVAVGLALSWGQVGRKTVRELAENPVTYLATETGCDVRRSPCAAVSGDRALVLGPAADGLRLKQAGFDTAAISLVEAGPVGPRGGEINGRPLLRDGDGWQLGLPADSVGVLRVRVVTGDGVSVADFELR